MYPCRRFERGVFRAGQATSNKGCWLVKNLSADRQAPAKAEYYAELNRYASGSSQELTCWYKV